MPKSRINKGDFNRVLLTETAPYEVPVIFNNEGFYEHIKNGDTHTQNLLISIRSNTWKIPLPYKIKKDTLGARSLSLPHPTSQLDYIEFYKDYDVLITSLCSRSKISLRAPVKIAGFFYDIDSKYSSADINPEAKEINDGSDNLNTPHASSYFSYNKYNFLYKFYESYEYHRIEKKFNFLMRFDISKCFDSIYTHSVAWAVKSKGFAKENHNGISFENKFDEIIRNSNHGETNGIIIGPETSRIFSEIILQRIDIETISDLSKDDLILGRDYTVKRYVDDYFVFSKKEETCRKIFKKFKENLELYKLHINESKTSLHTTPFMTSLTIAKSETRKFINDFIDQHIVNTDEATCDVVCKGSPSKKANRLIQEFKQILFSNVTDYSGVAGIALSRICKKISKLRNIAFAGNTDRESIFNLIYILLELCFFILSMTPRVRVTYLVIQISSICLDISKHLSYDHENNIKKKILDESILFLDLMIYDEKDDCKVESLNILTLLSTLDHEYLLPPQKLKSLYEKISSTHNTCYFEIITFLHYIKSNPIYNTLKEELLEKIEVTISLDRRAIESNTIHLLLDCMSCPYITEKLKKKFLQLVLDQYDIPNKNKINDFLKSLSKTWFTNWDSQINLQRAIDKKGLKFTY
ncbi:antiviral reverse transcriptase Drt3b [Pseudomonas donghuensis]|uniref:RNA-directed DNA polymerase n=1 Tax=Pseudomonas donghuensis TaxID=1163398 RepID=A0AAP0SHM4_9PSED|nr:antiviral reverse transcriptase Drt3b [Pseudomonas donghuensis]KDO00213.1 RNA-directed DNA polymerase [Pseudomonas donghuensis]MCP6689973.1 RNA-directed DNA polymerase [Pseudomonas donghuensis]